MGFTASELQAASGNVIPDVIAPGLRVLFCGINPGLWSAATGHHFARPGNRFWPALHGAGFTPERLKPADQDRLPGYGLGITNLAPRASARADELTADELAAGGAALAERVITFKPAWLAVLGIGAYRTAFARPKATIGPQPDRIGDTGIWILPNPSGLNASYQLPRLIEEFGKLRAAAAG
ncbi:G/U mismatch-specific DNA glycosylase [Catenuloplanes sp. NPDC051500]|uniref:G/U mismatch-specific DNA glycosylase n=1 Tax=Catenuloplanes sp. NPDC051500 TaxID=3363959 RepID=UPI003798DF94